MQKYQEKAKRYQAYYDEIQSLETVGEMEVVVRSLNKEVLTVLELFD